VQNRYNLSDRANEPVLDYCQRDGIRFIPWFPITTGRLAKPGGPLQRIADEHGATPAQLALAWLLHRSPVVLPIPGHINGFASRRERRCCADRTLQRPASTTQRSDYVSTSKTNDRTTNDP
jgi:diketogulonate reductase-like aldo/keto reductase